MTGRKKSAKRAMRKTDKPARNGAMPSAARRLPSP
jgi:hypothetical protein